MRSKTDETDARIKQLSDELRSSKEELGKRCVARQHEAVVSMLNDVERLSGQQDFLNVTRRGKSCQIRVVVCKSLVTRRIATFEGLESPKSDF